MFLSKQAMGKVCGKINAIISLLDVYYLHDRKVVILPKLSVPVDDIRNSTFVVRNIPLVLCTGQTQLERKSLLLASLNVTNLPGPNVGPLLKRAYFEQEIHTRSEHDRATYTAHRELQESEMTRENRGM